MSVAALSDTFVTPEQARGALRLAGAQKALLYAILVSLGLSLAGFLLFFIFSGTINDKRIRPRCLHIRGWWPSNDKFRGV